MPYHVELRPRARRGLERLLIEDRNAVLQGLLQLTSDPRPPGTRKLVTTKPIWRIRVRDIRVIYAVFDADNHIIVGITERRSERTYRDIDSLF